MDGEQGKGQLRGAIAVNWGQPGVVFTARTALLLPIGLPMSSLRTCGALGSCARQHGCGALWTVTCFSSLAVVSFLLHGVAVLPGESNWYSSDPMQSLWDYNGYSRRRGLLVWAPWAPCSLSCQGDSPLPSPGLTAPKSPSPTQSPSNDSFWT